MHLIRDVLDKRLLDCNNHRMGRVDGLIMRVPENGQPSITHIVIGGKVLSDRIGARTAAFTRKIARWIGPKRLAPIRIPWSKVKTMGRDIRLEIDFEDTDARVWEKWIEKHVIKRIPGSG